MTGLAAVLIILPPIVFVGVLLGFRYLGRQAKYLAVAEYWIFLPTTEPPDGDAVMRAMMDPAGGSPIGSREGAVFSDVRLGVDFVLRERNPYSFRPDVMQQSGPPPSAECLDGFAHAKSMVRIRYVSERPLPDRRHLTFMPYFAKGYCDVGNGTAVFDVQRQVAWSANEFRAMLAQTKAPEEPEANVQVVWVEGQEGGHFETHGMVRAGMSELHSLPAPTDQRVILEAVMWQLIQHLWATTEPAASIELENEYDRFICELGYIGPYKRSVKVLRLHRVNS